MYFPGSNMPGVEFRLSYQLFIGEGRECLLRGPEHVIFTAACNCHNFPTCASALQRLLLSHWSWHCWGFHLPNSPLISLLRDCVIGQFLTLPMAHHGQGEKAVCLCASCLVVFVNVILRKYLLPIPNYWTLNVNVFEYAPLCTHPCVYESERETEHFSFNLCCRLLQGWFDAATQW